MLVQRSRVIVDVPDDSIQHPFDIHAREPCSSVSRVLMKDAGGTSEDNIPKCQWS